MVVDDQEEDDFDRRRVYLENYLIIIFSLFLGCLRPSYMGLRQFLNNFLSISFSF
jgi:hypothetical protein